MPPIKTNAPQNYRLILPRPSQDTDPATTSEASLSGKRVSGANPSILKQAMVAREKSRESRDRPQTELKQMHKEYLAQHGTSFVATKTERTNQQILSTITARSNWEYIKNLFINPDEAQYKILEFINLRSKAKSHNSALQLGELLKNKLKKEDKKTINDLKIFVTRVTNQISSANSRKNRKNKVNQLRTALSLSTEKGIETREKVERKIEKNRSTPDAATPGPGAIGAVTPISPKESQSSAPVATSGASPSGITVSAEDNDKLKVQPAQYFKLNCVSQIVELEKLRKEYKLRCSKSFKRIVTIPSDEDIRSTMTTSRDWDKIKKLFINPDQAGDEMLSYIKSHGQYTGIKSASLQKSPIRNNLKKFDPYITQRLKTFSWKVIREANSIYSETNRQQEINELKAALSLTKEGEKSSPEVGAAAKAGEKYIKSSEPETTEIATSEPMIVGADEPEPMTIEVETEEQTTLEAAKALLQLAQPDRDNQT